MAVSPNHVIPAQAGIPRTPPLPRVRPGIPACAGVTASG